MIWTRNGPNMTDKIIPAITVIRFLEKNVDNTKLSDADYRDICRTTLAAAEFGIDHTASVLSGTSDYTLLDMIKHMRDRVDHTKDR